MAMFNSYVKITRGYIKYIYIYIIDGHFMNVNQLITRGKPARRPKTINMCLLICKSLLKFKVIGENTTSKLKRLRVNPISGHHMFEINQLYRLKPIHPSHFQTNPKIRLPVGRFTCIYIIRRIIMIIIVVIINTIKIVIIIITNN